jgi:hypothetical protein
VGPDEWSSFVANMQEAYTFKLLREHTLLIRPGDFLVRYPEQAFDKLTYLQIFYRPIWVRGETDDVQT